MKVRINIAPHTIYGTAACSLYLVKAVFFFSSHSLGLKPTAENSSDVISVKVGFLFIVSLLENKFALFKKLLRCLDNF